MGKEGGKVLELMQLRNLDVAGDKGTDHFSVSLKSLKK